MFFAVFLYFYDECLVIHTARKRKFINRVSLTNRQFELFNDLSDEWEFLFLHGLKLETCRFSSMFCYKPADLKS